MLPTRRTLNHVKHRITVLDFDDYLVSVWGLGMVAVESSSCAKLSVVVSVVSARLGDVRLAD